MGVDWRHVRGSCSECGAERVYASDDGQRVCLACGWTSTPLLSEQLPEIVGLLDRLVGWRPLAVLMALAVYVVADVCPPAVLLGMSAFAIFLVVCELLRILG